MRAVTSPPQRDALLLARRGPGGVGDREPERGRADLILARRKRALRVSFIVAVLAPDAGSVPRTVPIAIALRPRRAFRAMLARIVSVVVNSCRG